MERSNKMNGFWTYRARIVTVELRRPSRRRRRVALDLLHLAIHAVKNLRLISTVQPVGEKRG